MQSKATRLLTRGVSGVVLCIVGVAMMWNSIKTSTWEPAQATLTSVSLIERHGRSGTFTIPDVSYQYENSGHQYRGHGIKHGSKTPAVGAPLIVYINPHDPSQSSVSKGLQLNDFTQPTAIPLIMGLLLITASSIACFVTPSRKA